MKSIRNLAIGAALAASLAAPLAWAAPHAKIDAAQATKIALHRYPGRVTEKVALENEEGSWQYSVMVRSNDGTLREVMVNAMNGSIANVEVTSQSKENRESKAEKAQQGRAHQKSQGGGDRD